MLEDKQRFIYMASSLPVKVELLKQKDTELAAQKGNIMSALEAFKTVITIT